MGFYPEKEQPESLGPDPIAKGQYRRYLLVIPLFNHGATVTTVVKAALETGLKVLIIDDGSTDNGAKDLELLGCRVHRFDTNRGKGAAILAAAEIATGEGFDYICTVDADGQHDPAHILQLVHVSEESPHPSMVIGVRDMEQETVPASSKFGRNFSNFWVRLECGADLEDTQSGMRIYPAGLLGSLGISTSRYDFEIESLVRLVWAGVEVKEVAVPVHYPEPGKRISHFRGFMDNFRLSLLHSRLVTRRLLPLPHQQLAGERKKTPTIVVKKPLQTLKNLCREHSSPLMLATAVWMGLFLGALPLIACHTLVIIYVTHRLHLNIVAAVAASQFCMPPVVPAICIEVGYFIRHGSFILDPSWERWLLEIHHRLFDWFIGSLVVGPILGGLGAGLTWWWARKFVNREKRVVEAER